MGDENSERDIYKEAEDFLRRREYSQPHSTGVVEQYDWLISVIADFHREQQSYFYINNCALCGKRKGGREKVFDGQYCRICTDCLKEFKVKKNRVVLE